MDDWIDIGALDNFGEDEPSAVNAEGVKLAVFRIGNELFALLDRCTHGVARLSEGYIEDGCVECPLHQGLFDIRTGAPRGAPVTEAVKTFSVRVVADRVQVNIENVEENETPQVQKISSVIKSINLVTDDVAVLNLAFETELTIAAKAGQYIDILFDDNRRSYSIANLESSKEIELHIRHMPGGLFTEKVFSDLRVDDELNFEGPQGDFYLRDNDSPIIMLASGTGFAPIKAMIESLIKMGSQKTVKFYWGGRRPKDIYHQELCQQWQEQLSWFEFIPVISDQKEEDAWDGRSGFVHQAVMQDITDMSNYQVYACGVPAMVEAAQNDFTKEGLLPEDQFYSDAFLSLSDKK